MSSLKRKQNPFRLQLIEEIKKHDCLWNTQKEFFGLEKGPSVRAWQAIAKKMDMEVNEARAKWKNLKDTYRRELRKTLLDDTYKGKWLYFDEMDFLRDVIDLAEILDKQEPEAFEVVHIEKSNSPFLSDQDAAYLYVDEKSPPVKKRRKKESDNNVEVSLLKKEEVKYDEEFLVSLLPFMRRLQPVRKLMVRSKIQEALVAELNRNRRNK